VEALVAFQIGTGDKGKGVENGRRVLCQPRGICLCDDGSLLVADHGNSCVLRFGRDDSVGSVVAGEEGKLLPEVDPLKDIDKPLSLPEGDGVLLRRPGHVLEHSSGGFLVVDMDESSVQLFGKNAKSQTLVPQGGKSVHTAIGSPDTVKHPRSVAIASDGSLIVCDTWSHRVLRYAPPGSPNAAEKPTVVAGVANSSGSSSDKLSFPSCVILEHNGAMLISDTNNHRVQRVLPDGSVTTIAGSADGRKGSGEAELNMPTGLCLDPEDGSLIVADRYNSRLLRFPAGSGAGSPGIVIAGPDVVLRPWGVQCAAGGVIYVSDESRAVVLRLEAHANVR